MTDRRRTKTIVRMEEKIGKGAKVFFKADRGWFMILGVKDPILLGRNKVDAFATIKELNEVQK